MESVIAHAPVENVRWLGNMQVSAKCGGIFAAIAKAQLEMKHPSKDKVAKIPSSKGSYEYRYADLPSVIDAIRALQKCGVAVIQNPSLEGNTVLITTILGHQDGADGQWIAGTLAMTVNDSRPQTIGSAVTYGRRYALQSLAGVAAEQDDDGGIASQPGQEQASKTQGNQGQDKKSADKPANTQDLVSKILQAFGQYGITRGKLETFLNSTMENMTKDMVDMLRKVLEGGPEMVTSTFGATSKSSAVDKLNEQFSS